MFNKFVQSWFQSSFDYREMATESIIWRPTFEGLKGHLSIQKTLAGWYLEEMTSYKTILSTFATKVHKYTQGVKSKSKSKHNNYNYDDCMV